MAELVAEAPAPVRAPAAPPTTPGRERPPLTDESRFLVVVVAVGGLAFLVRLWIALRGGGVGGTYGYDDGVYYAASDSLLWGRLPYRDFVLLHPPGIVLALTPFVWLGRLTHEHIGFETARVGWMLLGALNATLVVRICRRSGLVAAAAGGLCYAVWTPVALTETTVRLEPLVTCGLLVAVLLLVRRGATSSKLLLVAAGGALALAVSVKIWAVAPALLVMLWVWRGAGAKAVVWTVVGAVGAGALVDGPFLLTAPLKMIRMVVLDQIGRGRSLVDVPARLAHIFLPGLPLHPPWSPSPSLLAAAGVVLVMVVLACLGSAAGRFALSLLLVEVVVLLLSPTFFSYYNAFVGPGLALVVASTVGWVTAHRSRARPGGSMPGLTKLLALPVTLVALAALTASLVADSRAVVSDPFPAASLARAAVTSRCVTSDSPDALLLTDLFSRNLHRGCPVPVDLSGLTYDRDALPLRDNGTSTPRSENTVWQRDLGSYLFSGQSIFVLRPGSDGVHGPVVLRVQSLPDVRQGRGFALFANHPAAAPDERRTG